MKQIRLYLDEDAMRHSLAKGLKEKGIEVLTTLEANMVGKSDQEQLEFASKNEYSIFTFNVRDFCRLHQEWIEQEMEHFGIIVMPHQRQGVGEQIRLLSDLVKRKSAEEMRNQIDFL